MSKFTYTKQSYPNYIGIGTKSGGYICEWDPFAVKLNIPRHRGVSKIIVWGTSNLICFVERLGDHMCYIYDSESKSIWDVIKTEEGIWELQCMGDYLCLGMKQKVKRIKLPNVEVDCVYTGITSTFAMNRKGSLCAIPVGTLNAWYHSNTPETVCEAHSNSIACIAVDDTNTNYVATASEKGTIVRVWKGSKKLWEGRRGMEPARIVSMALSGSSIVVATNKGSVHYFNITDKETQGYIWNELPKSRYTWYCGENPIVVIRKTMVYMADATGLITIGSIESGETLFQTSLLGDSSSPFTVPLS